MVKDNNNVGEDGDWSCWARADERNDDSESRPARSCKRENVGEEGGGGSCFSGERAVMKGVRDGIRHWNGKQIKSSDKTGLKERARVLLCSFLYLVIPEVFVFVFQGIQDRDWLDGCGWMWMCGMRWGRVGL